MRSESVNAMSQSSVVALYFSTLLIVVMGVVGGVRGLTRHPHPNQNPEGTIGAFCNWDGVWYGRIVRDGYSFAPDRHSSVAFFPAYPVIARMFVKVLGISVESALLLVSHVSLFCAMLVFAEYMATDNSPHAWQTMIVLAAWPTGLFLRMAYAESLFLLLAALTLLGIQRQWHWIVIAAIVGVATATRSVGVALLLPALWDLWCRTPRWPQFVWRCAFSGLISVSGLICFMGYQWKEFGTPLAFVETQKHWSVREELPVLEKTLALVTCEPIWSVYSRSSRAYWGRDEYLRTPWISFQFWNPIYFTCCAVAVIYGVKRKWLSTPEWLLGGSLLLIPYVLQGYRMAMYGHGRFTCVVLPAFIVMGRVLQAQSPPVRYGIYAVMVGQLFCWSALFSAWHRIF